MKPVYKETFNRCLALIETMAPGDRLPPETELAALWSTSRTTVRAVLSQLDEMAIIAWTGRRKEVLRAPSPSDYFASAETRREAERVEPMFMRAVLGGDLAPGTILRESDLSREFGISVTAIREFLLQFSRFGLVQKEPNRHWVLTGFTREYAEELFDVRQMFEMQAFDRICARLEEPGIRAMLAGLLKRHEALERRMPEDYLSFSELDDAFHSGVLSVLDNRFVDDFLKVVKMIFHFHYQWNKADERERNVAALAEHIAILKALLEADAHRAREYLREHLRNAQRTLLASVRWTE